MLTDVKKDVNIGTNTHLLSMWIKLLLLGHFRQFPWHQYHINTDYALQGMWTDVNGALLPQKTKYVNIGTVTHLF